MTRFARIAVCVAVCSVAAVPAPAQEPAPAPGAPGRAVVEFRWLSSKPVKGVTEDKGFQTTCGPALSYAHLKPVLTSADVAGTTLKHHDFSKSGLGGERYTVDFQLTAAARKKLAAEAGDAPVVELATFVDGKYWGTGIIRKGEVGKFTPSAGFLNAKAEAERIVEACKPGA